MPFYFLLNFCIEIHISASFVTLFFLCCLDDSDEPEGLVRHLPRRVLRAGGQKRTKKLVGTRMEADEDEDEDEEEDVPANEDLGQWSRRDLARVGSRIPPFVKPVLEEADEERLTHLQTASAMELYKLFQPDTFAEEIVYQSKLYAVQKNKKQALDIMSVDTYRYTFLPYCILYIDFFYWFLYRLVFIFILKEAIQ